MISASVHCDAKRCRIKPLHRFMHAFRHGSDRCASEVLRTLPALAEAQKNVLPKKLDRLFEDPDLVGGGVSSLQEELHARLQYCSNRRKVNGKFVCGRMLPKDYEGETCPNPECGYPPSEFVDHVIELKKLYPLLLRHTDLLQRIADYYHISIARLSQPPDDPKARVWCTESGLIARRDYAANPANFTLDIVPKLDEEGFYEKDNGDLSDCKIIECEGEECETGYYRVRLLCGTEHILVNEDRSRVHKKGGLVPINVTVMQDGAEVFKSSFMNYSNNGCTEQIENVGEAFRRRQDFNSFMGATSGGRNHPNVDEKLIWYEKQRRHLTRQGTMCKGAVSCHYAGRKVTVYDVKIVRNEYHRTLDHPELIKQGTMGLRNLNSMNPFLFGFEAVGAGRRALYSFLMNASKSTPSTEQESKQLFNVAEDLRGSDEWKSNSQETGVKAKTVAEAGSLHHDLVPDPTQNSWSRLVMGVMHFLGIVDNTFRDFILAVAPMDARRTLAQASKALRQGPGTKPLASYVTVDPDTQTAEFNSAGEKLHQKQKWRKTMMLFDLYPLFEGDSEKTREMHRVCCILAKSLFWAHYRCMMLSLFLLSFFVVVFLPVHRDMATVCPTHFPFR